MIEIRDTYDNIIKCKILFTFYINHKNFIVYLDEEQNILASFYEKMDENTIKIYPIKNDDDFDIVDREINRRCS